MGKGIGGHTKPNNGLTNEWLTPPDIVRALGPFDLDPCAMVNQPWATAAKHYTRQENGLLLPWFGRVWINPPYGQLTGTWLERLASYGNGIAIVFARTETAMFFANVWPAASALLFVRGRLHFHHPDGRRAKANSGGPSVLVAFGEQNARALANSGIAGALVVGWKTNGVSP